MYHWGALLQMLGCQFLLQRKQSDRAAAACAFAAHHCLHSKPSYVSEPVLWLAYFGGTFSNKMI